MDVSYPVASTLELEPLLTTILEQLSSVVDYTGATFLQREGDNLVVMAHRGPIPIEEAKKIRLPLAKAASRHVILKQEPVIIPDVHADTPLARAYHRAAGEDVKPLFSYVHSWMAVPLTVKEHVIGILSLDHEEVNFYTPHHAEVAQVFADQVAVFVENAQLYAETRKRADEIQALFSVQQAITRRLDPDDVLQMIADEARRLTATEMSAVYLLEGEQLEIAVVSGDVTKELRGYLLPLSGSVAGLAVTHGRPYLVTDTDADPAVNRNLTERVGARSFVTVPLLSEEKPIGAITVANKQAGTLGQEDERVLAMLASGAVIALQNARLYERAQQAAAAEERNRLARELHDAVTQTLFSASLIADVLPRLWEKDEEQGRQRLAELGELTRGALAEMRTLLMELRPAALTEVGIGELLRQLSSGLAGRARLPIDLNLDCRRDLPPDVRVALYRIAQESLNNTIKHAGAKNVTIDLSCTEEGARLCIADDGRGFDLERTGQNTLGLRIMRERAEKIGAKLEIDSRIGVGTTVTVTWPDEAPVRRE